MSKNLNVFKTVLLAFALCTCISTLMGCQDNLTDNDHYKPRLSTGNAYEILESEGNYTTFLKGVDLAGFRQIVDGKSILTVIAPDDDAFSTFLSQKGYSSIDDLNTTDPQYLKRLIGYHLMYYAFDWDKMVNFRPQEGDGATEEEKMVDAGLYYKHRTHSSNPVEEVRVKLTPNATADTLIKLYHYELYLPVFSNKLFETKGIDADYNYSYFYPDSKWGGSGSNSNGYFNVNNASVKDDDNVITDNGYLYHVDQVLEPLGTIYDELKSNPDYSDYVALYDSYSTYDEAATETSTELGYNVYVHRHGELPSIALEWPNESSYSGFTSNEKTGYNLFVPTNSALDNFFRTYWTAESGYKSLDDLDPLIMKYFVYQSFSSSSMLVFPEEIKNGTVKTYYETPVNIDPDKVTDRKICANGVFYGMDNMDAPAIFSSVVGPAFKDSLYTYYLYALDNSGLVLSLSSSASNFVTLMPSNDQMRNAEPAIRLYTSTSGKELQQYSYEAGDYATMSKNTMLSMCNIHTATNVSELPTTGSKVILTNTPYNYWYVRDGKITSSANFNQLLSPEYAGGDPFVEFHEITNAGNAWDNGKSYSYDAIEPFEAASGDGLAHTLSVANDKNYCYYLFAQLLNKAGLLDVANNCLDASVVASTDTRFIVFIPTNEAIKDNLASLPGCSKLKVKDDGTLSGTCTGNNKTALAAYLRNYFITALQNSFTDYPYIGSSCNGEFYTSGNYKIYINDDAGSLSVHFTNAEVNNTVKVSSTYFYLPFAFNDGCFHLIDGVLN